MERRDDFESICADVENAISDALARHSLETFDALAVCAVVEAMATPFKIHHLKGTRLTRTLGRIGQRACCESQLVRLVEEVKAPGSLIVNPMMDAIAGTLTKQRAIADADLPRKTLEFLNDLPRFADGEAAEEAELLTKRIPGPPFQTARQHLAKGGAFASALRYLQQAQIVSFSDEDESWSLPGYPAFDFD